MTAMTPERLRWLATGEYEDDLVEVRNGDLRTAADEWESAILAKNAERDEQDVKLARAQTRIEELEKRLAEAEKKET